MAFHKKFRSIVAIASVLLFQLLDQTTKVDACSCIAQARDLCDFIDAADVVLKAKALTRSDQTNINDEVTYTVLTETLYKAEPYVRYAQEISFVTGGNSALCGVYLKLEEEYLIGLYRSSGALTVGLCDLFQRWSDVSEDDKKTLEDGCDNTDPCNGECRDYQECLLYDDAVLEEYYCADVCSPDSCGDEQVCSLEDVQCIRAPCPPIAVCTDSPCGGTCTETQECLLYTDGDANEYYCADVCIPATCGDEQSCSLVDVDCVTDPCPPVAVCTDIDCGGTCTDNQECLLYTGGDADEYYCADVCVPSTCGDEETCTLEEVQCYREPCPPVAVCTDQCGGCDESQECLMYQRNGKFYCSDNCANNPCGEYETCTTKVRKWCRHSGFDGCPRRRRCK